MPLHQTIRIQSDGAFRSTTLLQTPWQNHPKCHSMTKQVNNYIFIFYTIDANHIKSYPIKSHHRMELLCAYNNVYAYLRMQGYRPQLHNLDNKSSHNVEAFITENNASFQYTSPDIHRTNIAEHAICIWKMLCCHVCGYYQIRLPLQLVQKPIAHRHHPQHDAPMHPKPKPLCS
ncbi:hypothetical protein ACHAW6_010208 [Cyclotella cf. meneghiniana]